MNQLAQPGTVAEITVDENFPHSPEVVWKALTSSDLMSRWMMPPKGFAPVAGTLFTFQTKPAGEWDGIIQCQVLEVLPNERLSYAWSGGHKDNEGYGSRLDTVVTLTLTPTATGTRVRLVHSGFVLPDNDIAYRNMSDGWRVVVKRLDAVVAEEASPLTQH